MSTVFKLVRFDLLVSPPAQRPLEIKKVVIQQTSGGRNSLSLKTLRACPTTSNFFFFFYPGRKAKHYYEYYYLN